MTLLTGDSLDLPGEGMTLIAYTAEPGSRAEEQLDFPAGWSAGNNKRSTGPAPASPHTAAAMPHDGDERN